MNQLRRSRPFLLLPLLLLSLAPARLLAWGCKGHQTVALIAMNHLSPEAKELVETLLRENPPDPQTGRACGGADLGLLAAASTWPDDIRQRPRTGPWHYINIPRGAAHDSLQKFCGDRGCITSALAEQLEILKDRKAEPQKRAEAVRFIVHFVGDLHMPLHASDNNDLGGNCVPVTYFRRKPAPGQPSFRPNLHSLWDTAIVERDMEGAEPPEYALELEDRFRGSVDAWRNAGIDLDQWTWESHEWAESVAYGKLRPEIPAEIPQAVRGCGDANQVGDRLFALHVTAGESYQLAAAAVVRERLEQAGIRLAMILNEAARPQPAD